MDANPKPIQEKVAVLGLTNRLQTALHDRLGIDSTPLAEAHGPVDVIVADSTDGPAYFMNYLDAGIAAKSLPGLYRTEATGC